MAIPLIPVAGLALGALASLSLLAIQNLLQDRTFGSDPIVPPPNPQIPPFTPPFTGGQCSGNPNRGYFVRVTRFYNPNTQQEYTNPNPARFGNGAQIVAGRSIVSVVNRDVGFFQDWLITDNLGQTYTYGGFGGGNTSGDIPITDFTVGFYLHDYPTNSAVPDNCGNLPNPNPPVPPSVGGGSLVPIVDSPIEVYGGIAIPSFAALLAALKAIADGIAAIADVLDGVRKIGDAINKIREILDDFLNRWNDKEKENPQKRKISVGAWRELAVDGGFGAAKFTSQGIEYSPYQLQIEVQSFPSTVSRRLGVNSPSYAHLEPIGWIFLRSANGGYSEPVPIRYLRNSISLAEDTNGISYSFRENPLAKAKCRIWYSSAPSITGNI